MESIENTPKFKHFSIEQIPALLGRFKSISQRFQGLYFGNSVSIGEKIYRIGKSSEENSPLSLMQLYMALALSNGVQDISEIKGERNKLMADELVERKALKDLKILDLGCGGQPYFSILARKMGATIYTVDILDIDSMVDQYRLEYDFLPEDIIELKNFHIAGDLNSENIVDVIHKKTGGDFNFVTEAHLASGAERGGKNVVSFNGSKISKEIINSDGLYYNANGQTKLTHASKL